MVTGIPDTSHHRSHKQLKQATDNMPEQGKQLAKDVSDLSKQLGGPQLVFDITDQSDREALLEKIAKRFSKNQSSCSSIT